MDQLASSWQTCSKKGGEGVEYLEVEHGHEADDDDPDDRAQLGLRQEGERPPLPEKGRKPGVAVLGSLPLSLTAR